MKNPNFINGSEEKALFNIIMSVWLFTYMVHKCLMSLKIYLESFWYNSQSSTVPFPVYNTLGKMSDKVVTWQEESDHLSFGPSLFGELDTSGN